MPTQYPILIIGAGLSGLTTARLLTNSRIPCITFESSPSTRTQGYAISLRDWGFNALLKSLGNLPLSSLTRGVAPDRALGGWGWLDQSWRNNQTGEVIMMPPREGKEKPSILRANRNALRSWVADAGDEEVDVRYGHRLVGVDFEGGVVIARFDNGASYKGSLLIGADGVHSTVRSILLPAVTPEILPVLVYHGDFRLSRDEYERIIRPHSGESTIVAGVGDGFNTPLTVCNITSDTVHMDWTYSRPGVKDDVLFNSSITSEEAKVIPEALVEEINSRQLGEPWSLFINGDAMREHKVFNWLVRCVSVERGDLDSCIGKNVVFVGDSWHAMPIFGGEGGNHALVDGVELARKLVEVIRRGEDVQEAVKAYYDGAWRRCVDAVRRSKQRFYQLHRPISEWVEIAEKQKLAQKGA
ncbi:FAD-dependent oxidoreductase [Aspergillus undulatus]|uniref:FAD-dependent oxidoreductase n=1 Tax=Aspergillus undulatus TaxID=1810928 RepID=UPI003CCDF0F9